MESPQPSCSLICSRSEPFRPEEQLLSVEGAIFLITNLVTPLGKYSYNLIINIWSDIPQFLNHLLSESKLHPLVFSVRSTFDLVKFWFEIFRSLRI